MKKITLLFSLLISSIGFSQTELLTNGDFEQGATAWGGDAFNAVDDGSGSNNRNEANVTTRGNAWDVSLNQPVSLTAGTTYVLSYIAYTDAITGTRTMAAGIGQNQGPWAALTSNPALTSTPTTFTYTYTVNYASPDVSRVVFDMGAEAGYVFIDDVSLVEFVDTEAPTDFTASVGTVGATSVELLLNATDNSGSVTYDVTYGATTTQATGDSGVETSMTINGLTPEAAYTFSVSASDSSSNVAANNPIELSATTVEDTNTACAGTSTSASEGAYSLGYNYSFETVGNDVNVSFELLDTDKTGFVPQIFILPNTYINMDSSAAPIYTGVITGTSGQTLKFAIRGAYEGGLVISQSFEYVVGDDCVETPDEDNVTLSDLQLDGTTIGGFSGSTISYDVVVNESDAIPVVSATAAFGTVGTITQASELPGTATFDVTSQSTNFTQTYTVNFVFVGPQTAAPIPPPRDASDVISLFSNAYTNTTVETWSATWDDSSIDDIQVSGDDVKRITFTNFLGIEFTNNRIDATNFTHFHIDIFTDEATLDKVFTLKFSDWAGGIAEDHSILFSATNASIPSLPNPNPGTWISLDIPFSDWSAGARNDLAQLIISSSLGTVYVDNIYLYKAATAGLEDISANTTKMYPNPVKGVVNFSSASNVALDVAVFDMLGKQVLRANAVQSQLNISSLNPGMYFVKMTQGSNVSTKKLLVN